MLEPASGARERLVAKYRTDLQPVRKQDVLRNGCDVHVAADRVEVAERERAAGVHAHERLTEERAEPGRDAIDVLLGRLGSGRPQSGRLPALEAQRPGIQVSFEVVGDDLEPGRPPQEPDRLVERNEAASETTRGSSLGASLLPRQSSTSKTQIAAR